MRASTVAAMFVVWLLTLWVGLECGYRIAARHHMTYAAAVTLATERQQTGYDKGWSACQEQF